MQSRGTLRKSTSEGVLLAALHDGMFSFFAHLARTRCQIEFAWSHSTGMHFNTMRKTICAFCSRARLSSQLVDQQALSTVEFGRAVFFPCDQLDSGVGCLDMKISGVGHRIKGVSAPGKDIFQVESPTSKRASITGFFPCAELTRSRCKGLAEDASKPWGARSARFAP